MGSCFNHVIFEGNLTENQLKTQFSQYQKDQEYEHGHGAYSGTLATTRGLEVQKKCFQTETEAEAYIANNTEKWGSAIAVQFKETKTTTKKEPTFNGKSAACNTSIRSTLCLRFTSWDEKEIITADQLTAPQKEQILKAYKDFNDSSRAEKLLRDEQFSLVRKLQNIEEEFNTEEFKKLKKNRSELKKTREKLAKNKAKFEELDKKLGDKLYKYETEELGTKWIVGGWCAE